MEWSLGQKFELKERNGDPMIRGAKVRFTKAQIGLFKLPLMHLFFSFKKISSLSSFPAPNTRLWKVAVTRFWNKDQTFGLRIYDLTSGLGNGMIAVEVVGDRPEDYLEERRREVELMRQRGVTGYAVDCFRRSNPKPSTSAASTSGVRRKSAKKKKLASLQSQPYFSQIPQHNTVHVEFIDGG